MACSRNLGRMRSEIAWYVLEAANLPWSPWVDEILSRETVRLIFIKTYSWQEG